jgi:chlorophyllide a reductase subunit Y
VTARGWLERIGDACGVRGRGSIGQERGSCRPFAAPCRHADPKGRITLSGYEGSELLVARLLVESGADVRYVGTACPRTEWSDADREWLEARACT